jgi:hypothetical protein
MADVDGLDKYFQGGDKPPDSPSSDGLDKYFQGDSNTLPPNRLKSMGQAAAGAAFSGAGATAGGILGFKAGAATGNPIAATVATLGGFVGGGLAGEEAARGLGIPKITEMAPADRPFAYGTASVVSSGMSLLPVAGALITGVRARNIGIGKMFNDIVETAQRIPKRFWLAAEGVPAIASGVAAGVSEEVNPGDEWSRLGAEVGTGVVSSALIYRTVYAAGAKIIGSTLDRFGTERQVQRGAKALHQLLANDGVDPETVIRAAKNAGYPDLTVGQFTGDPTMIGVEKDLIQHSKRFGQRAADTLKATFDVMRMRINLLAQTGDPNDLRLAARMRSEMFNAQIKAKLDNAKDDVVRKIAPLVQDARGDAAMVSNISFNALSKQLDDVEAHASVLWGAVDLKAKIGVSNVEKEIERIVYLGGNQLGPGMVPKFVYEMVDEAKTSTTGGVKILGADGRPVAVTTAETEFRNMKANRSRLLEMARVARNELKDGEANTYNSLAAAILDDMDAKLGADGNSAYDIARAFTREMHDVFTRSFAGKAMASTKFGDRMDPGVMLRKAMAGGNETSVEQMADLALATRFMRSKGLDDNTSVDVMLEAQRRIIRIMSADAYDTTTGRVNTDTLKSFMNKHDELLRSFPEVKNEMREALKSEEGLRKMEMRFDGVKGLVGRYSAMAKISGGDPLTYVTEVLRSTDGQEEKLVKLVNMAKKGGTNRQGVTTVNPKTALDSVRATIYNAAINASSTKDGVLDLNVFEAMLTRPSVTGNKPVIQIMQEQGLLDRDGVNELKTMFAVAGNMKKWQSQAMTVDTGDKQASWLMSLLARAGGSIGLSTAKSAAGIKGSGADLIVHSAVARGMDHVVTTLPLAKQKDVIVALMTDRQAFARAMERTDDVARQAANTRFMNAWLTQWGLTSEIAKEGAGIASYLMTDEELK